MIKAHIIWKRLINSQHIKGVFYKKIVFKSSTGLDKITTRKFEENIDDNVNLIINKLLNGTYKFTRYKQLLLLKGPNKPPRTISIPTVRDKLTLSLLNELLENVYGEACHPAPPQLLISDISKSLNEFDSFIKLDIKSFYSSINQDTLIRIIKRKIRKKSIVELIVKAIQTDSLLYPITEKEPIRTKKSGIPEGLSISNSLANIYLNSIDEKYKNNKKIKYWRYVDDILVFSTSSTVNDIEEQIKADLRRLGLDTNDKTVKGDIKDGFDYLGYRINKSLFSVRKSAIYRIEHSLEEIIRHTSNLEYLEWRLNNTITGFVINNTSYGWVNFYSQINDLSLLFHLDILVSDLLKRHGAFNKIHCKRFVRTYHEITKAHHKTKYIPNYDTYSAEDKRIILKKIFGNDVQSWDENRINHEFKSIMTKELKNIEKDIESFS